MPPPHLLCPTQQSRVGEGPNPPSTPALSYTAESSRRRAQSPFHICSVLHSRVESSPWERMLGEEMTRAQGHE